MAKKWRVMLPACAFALALTVAQGTEFSASALAATNTHAAAASPSVADPPYPYQPKCTPATDGSTWRSPAGILYVCRYVSGVGYRWVPWVGSCPGAVPTTYAVRVVVC